jgi:hypothetical protein
MQDIGVDMKYIGEVIDGKMARLDAVIAQQDGFGDGMRTRPEPFEPRRLGKCIPAVQLGIAVEGDRSANSINKHQEAQPLPLPASVSTITWCGRCFEMTRMSILGRVKPSVQSIAITHERLAC